MKSYAIRLVFILCICCSTSAQNSVETVLKYNGDQFKKEVPNKPHFIFYFVPWSGESKNIAGIWEELAFKFNKKPDSEVVVAKVDCQAESDLCAYQDISDYPTIKFYRPGADPMGVRYRGVEDLNSVEQFMNRNLGNNAEFVFGARVPMIPEPDGGLHWLQDENFDEAMGSVSKAFVKFCTPWSSKCMDLDPIWKEIAKHFRFEDDFILGQVDCSMSKSTCNENEVRGYPTLLWLQDGIVVEKYESKDRSVETLKKYLLEKLGREEVRRLPVGYEEEKDPTDVVGLSKDEFYETLKGPKLVFVQYWTAWCSDCLAMDTAWETLAANYNEKNSKIIIATVDCVLDKAICDEQKVVDFPTLNLYQNGKLVSTYTGNHEVKDMTLFVDIAIKAKQEL
ncbi:thioredoxin domain-containing protein 5 [Folsomia candida]|uniref:Thioredoxin domain-containing protein 5 n=1 Tax=Folsomia candida TaxID=158441 RepID=A0A226EVC1_FOLCA|nr:thioredoxin domain-containing protein 5 [Folsomia candida]OXA61575.1 Thioredoxin domain-containing protein 5 [Folsomia candida]